MTAAVKDPLEAKTMEANLRALLVLKAAGQPFIEKYESGNYVDAKLYVHSALRISFLIRDLDSEYVENEALRLLVKKIQTLSDLESFFSQTAKVYYRPWLSQFILNFILRDQPEIADSLFLLNPDQNLTGLLEDWYIQSKLQFGECEGISVLRDIVKMYQMLFRDYVKKGGGKFDDNDISEQYQGDLEKMLGSEAAVKMIGRSIRSLEHLVTIMLNERKSVGPADGYGEVRYILEKFIPIGLPMIQSVLSGADEIEVLDALSSISKTAKQRFQPVIGKLIGKDPNVGDKYVRLINGNVKRFKQIGLILGEIGEEGFEKIPFEKLMARYKIRAGSDEEGRLLEIVANIAKTAKEGTGGLIEEIFDLYQAEAGKTLDDLNKLLRAFSYFVRVVNFHYDFEKMILSGETGQVNNETHFVSLRDLKKTLAIIKRDFRNGTDIKEAVAQAVRRRYYHRLGPEDRGRIWALMATHRIIHPHDELDFIYDIRGYKAGSSEIVITETRRPRQIQKRRRDASGRWEVMIEEIKIGKTREVLKIPLDQPLTAEDIDPEIILNETTRRNLARVLEALEVQDGEKFNPVLEFGTTAGGKSTIARIAAKILRVGYTRIQINERTDEFDLFGSFQPFEIQISLPEAVNRLREAFDRGEYNALEDVFSRLLTGSEGLFWQRFFSEEERGIILEGKKGLDFHEAKRLAIQKRIHARLKNLLQEAGDLLAVEHAPSLDPRPRERMRLIKSMAYMLNHEVGLRYKKGRFLEGYERGDLILLDEVNLANEEMLGVLYQLLTMGYLQHGGKVVEPAKGRKARVLATANPSSYGGRNRMSEAFMNRFETIYIDSMTDQEMAEILEGRIRKDLLASGLYKADDFRKQPGESAADYAGKMDSIFVREIGVTREQLVLIARVQEKINGALRNGKFLGMGADADYVFTIRNYFNLYADLTERKKQGKTLNLDAWLREAFMEYANVVMRSDVYLLNRPEALKNDPAYKTLRNIFGIVLGDHFARDSHANAHEAFDALVTSWFEKIDYQYDPQSHTLRIDGLTITGGNPQERKLIEELIETESTRYSQIAILKALLLNEPLLEVGQSGGGKTEAVGDLVQRLGWKYVTVSLGDATLESLLGNMEWDPKEKRFVYRPGILVRAMEEGSVLVLEELNMAKSGIIEILNEYFDEGTFTNPFTLEKVKIHEGFRLAATMNPVQGTTGQNIGRVSLSPALRNRFREVWVPHEKTREEMTEILKGRFGQNGAKVSAGILEKLQNFYAAYQEAFRFRGEAVYYTSLRDLTRIVRIMSYLMKTGGLDEEQAMARAVRRVYLAKTMTQDDRTDVRKLIGEAKILPGEIRSPSYRLSPDARFLEVYDGREAVARFDLAGQNSKLRTGIENEILEQEPGLAKEALARELRVRLEQTVREANLVENTHTMRNLAALMEAMAMDDRHILQGRFNPVLLLGETAGGKSSLAKYLAVALLGQGYTRIQMNERTDELDLFGSYEPREMELDLDDAIRIVQNAMQENEWVKIKKALKMLRQGRAEEGSDLLGDPVEVAHQMDLEENEARKELLEYLKSATAGTADSQIAKEAARRLKVVAYLVKNGAMSVEMEFREGRFLAAVKRGDFVVLDEVNLASEESIAVLYQFLTLGFIEYYNKDARDEQGNLRPQIEKVYPPPGFKLAATANPQGAGRNRLSEALLNRFEIQYVENMTHEEMAEIVRKENAGKEFFAGDMRVADVIAKLARLQSEINLALERGAFPSVGVGQYQGYLFTLRDLKRIMRSAEEILLGGDSSPPSEIMIRQAYLEYLGVLGRSDDEIARLIQLFKLNSFFPAFDPAQINLSFRETVDRRGRKVVRAGGFEIEERDYNGEGPSREADVIEELEEGPLTNLIRMAIVRSLLDSRSPMMAIGQSGGGKTEMIGDICRRLGWKYRSVSLANASLERLLGGYERDRETKIFRYILGELVRAMEEGAVFVLEEANMAPSGLVEILNEYFDEGTFTNPLTGKKVHIHRDFRLFATMNPEQGVTGTNSGRVGFSPALRSRFKEVWVPHIKTPAETKNIIRKKFSNHKIAVSEETVERLYRIYETYRQFVEGTSDGSGTYQPPRIGKENNEGYYTSLRDISKIADIMVQDMRRGVDETEALRYGVKRVYYLRLNNDEDRKTVRESILTGLDMLKTEYVWSLESGIYKIRRGGVDVAEVPESLLKKKKFVPTNSAREQMGFLIEAMSRSGGFRRSFNPVMLFGETSGGKSTMVEIASSIFRRKFRRIQMNQRTDEYDLLGAHHPVEMSLSLAESFEVIAENIRKRNYSKIRRGLTALKLTDSDLRRYSGAGDDPLSEAELIVRFTQKFLAEGMRRSNPRAVEIVKKLGVLIQNGSAGIDLVHQTGFFLEALGDRERGVPGQIVLLDEVNLANEEAVGLLYQLLTLGYIEYHGRRIYPGEGFELVTSGNPFTYSGRNRMSEAFMNRFEMQVIAEMTQEEMVEILWNGYNLAAAGGKKEVLEQIVSLQWDVQDASAGRRFDGFNLDNTYKFTLRNLERIVEDAKKRKEAEPARPLDECLWVEAYIEYAGLLSQTTEENHPDKNNLALLKSFFHERLFKKGYLFLDQSLPKLSGSQLQSAARALGLPTDKMDEAKIRERLQSIVLQSRQGSARATGQMTKLVSTLSQRYWPWFPDSEKLFTRHEKVRTTREGETEWVELGGVRVAKLSAFEMLEGFLRELQGDITTGVLKRAGGEPVMPIPEDYAARKIQSAADRRWKQEGGNLKDWIREEALKWAREELTDVPGIHDHLHTLSRKYFYTQAERIEKLVDLKSTQLVRMQLFKGFRDGGDIATEDSEGHPIIIHKSRPILEVGQSGGGKTEMIADIARELNWPYMSVALGAATVESLVGEFILNEETGAFEFRKGVLVRAMEEGAALVLEELNMAESGIIEILNEYFDRGTMTIQGRKVQVKIHRNFRLFATMNPTEGRTGKNAGRIPLSPALRSRFREVWVRSERTKGEQYRMALGGIRDLVSGLIERGVPEEAPDAYDLLDIDLTKRKIMERAGYQDPSELAKSQFGEDEGQAEPPKAPLRKPAVQTAAPVRTEPAVRMAKMPAKGEWEKMPKEEKKKIYEETFSIVTAKADIKLEAGDHWSWNPKDKILTYDEKDIERLSLNALLGVGIHEAMHRIGTRYLSLFHEFFDDYGIENRVFNTLEDGRIENWARFLFGGAAAPLRATNDEVVFGKYKDLEELIKRFIHEREDGGKIAYSSALMNFMLYLGKRGSDADAVKKTIPKFLEALGQRDPELREDAEQLIRAGYFGGARAEDILDPPNQRKARGVFSLIPVKQDETGQYQFDGNPSESTVEDLAIEQGILIREYMMPVIYKWAARDLADGNFEDAKGKGGREVIPKKSGKGGGKGDPSGSEKSGGKGKPQKGEGKQGKERGEGKDDAGEPSGADEDQGEDAGGKPQGMPKPGKSGKGKESKPMSPDDWKKLWDKLSDQEKKKILDGFDKNTPDKPRDRTAKDARDYQNAKQDSDIAKPMSERDRLMGFLGKMITELAGYLRDIIQNSSRPKEITGLKRGRIDVRRLINSMARGFTDMRFYKQRILPQKKNVKFTIIVDESGSMQGMGDPSQPAAQNVAAKGYRTLMGVTLIMEVLESLGIDFSVRGYQSTTHLHKRFKGQRIPPGEEDRYLRGAHEDIPDGYTTRHEKESIIGDLYRSIGLGGNNEGPALETAIRDAGEAGGDKHFIIIITDGMGDVEAIKKNVEGLRARNGIVSGTKVEFIAVGLGNDTESVPQNYGGQYSIHLKDDEIHKLPAELKRVLQEVIRGVFQPGAPGSSRLLHMAQSFGMSGLAGMVGEERVRGARIPGIRNPPPSISRPGLCKFSRRRIRRFF
jgi:MoxR-like ATPase